MVYVALLRGINVGGNNKVDMRQLKVVFEQAGMESVSTYINSGNVIFSNQSSSKNLTKKLEQAIAAAFGFPVKVVLRDIESMRKIVGALPKDWQNDTNTKCDVMFLWEAVDKSAVLKDLVIKPDIDEVRYVPGAVLWCIQRKNATRTGLLRVTGTDLYKQVTIRNCNTTRKLLERMEQIDN